MSPARLLVLPAALLAAGCDPAAGIRVRTSLKPAPVGACLDSALEQSPLLWRTEMKDQTPYDARHGERHLSAIFRHGTTSPYAGNLTIQTLDDSVSNVTLNFVWLGRLKSVPDTARCWMAEQGTALVRELRAVCAPGSPDSVTCAQWEVLNRHPPACGAGH